MAGNATAGDIGTTQVTIGLTGGLTGQVKKCARNFPNFEMSLCMTREINLPVHMFSSGCCSFVVYDGLFRTSMFPVSCDAWKK